MSASWAPRRYEPDDDPKIAALLRLCYPRHRGLEYWAWILKHSPLGFHGPEGDIWVAETRTRDLVGYYGRIRVPMRFRGASIVGSQVAMLATHPDYRRQGVFERLAAGALEDAKKNGIGVTFAFPNEFSYPGSVKHGWVDYGRVKDLTSVLNPEDFLTRVQGNSVTKACVSILLSFAGPRGDGTRSRGGAPRVDVRPGFLDDAGLVWDSLKHAYDLGIERTQAYLEWRYHRRWGDYAILSAVRGPQTLGYAVFRTVERAGEKRGHICELISRDDETGAYEALLAEVLRKSREESITSVSASAACSQGLQTILKGARFRNIALLNKMFRGGAYGNVVALFLHDGQRVHPGPFSWYHSIGDRDFG